MTAIQWTPWQCSAPMRARAVCHGDRASRDVDAAPDKGIDWDRLHAILSKLAKPAARPEDEDAPCWVAVSSGCPQTASAAIAEMDATPGSDR